MTATAHLYSGKPEAYYSGARADMVSCLPQNQAAIVLELGCGDGSTGALARAAGKAGTYVGIELDPSAAAIAATQLSAVLVGDIAALDLTQHHGRYDALIASEVLEHLIDPWAALIKLMPCLKPGALVLASSPNIAHWRVIIRLIFGQFSHTETGVMDRSHLRWFTPSSYSALLESAGLWVESVQPITPFAARTRWLNRLTAGRFRHLFMTQIYIIARKPL